MGIYYSLHLACTLLALVGLAQPLTAEDRVALVIGNDDYEHLNLLGSCVKDANTMESQLRARGFRVAATVRNANLTEMTRAKNTFLSQAQGADVALVFYSGHGMLVAANLDTTFNYLLPTDIDLQTGQNTEMERKAISVQSLLNGLAEVGVPCKIAILDACQNNNFSASKSATSKGSGTSGTQALFPGDAYLALATRPGTTATGTDSLSPFTECIARQLQADASEILPVFFAGVKDAVESSYPDQIVTTQSTLSKKLIAFTFGSPRNQDLPPVPSALAFVKSFIASETPGRMADWLAHFAPLPYYCYADPPERASSAFIRQDRAKLENRWTTRDYRVRGEPLTIENGQSATASYVADYQYSGSGGKAASGRTRVSLGLALSGGQWRITRFDEDVYKDLVPDTSPLVHNTVSQGGYLFPDSATRQLLDYELQQLSPGALFRARNEIFARHGYIFSSPAGQAVAQSLPGYLGRTRDQDAIFRSLNSHERTNVLRIQDYERR